MGCSGLSKQGPAEHIFTALGGSQCVSERKGERKTERQREIEKNKHNKQPNKDTARTRKVS
jgi:hypothetical protein